ncbi:SDR family oxidoreductase [Telluribacter sp. SYSU D00476]|uniref:SDR family NAD(P)-dependent oxidoreductase n=1 Tax=Telluribacter sp. SYSU D00476 TaxID=2811430 RepID=UPI001FF5A9F7|nr:SDR family oxidoreductase [Telluribacter sp. SYSU D00476]
MNTETVKTALITGASSGIGRELAKLFAKDGYNLVLVSRGEDTLQQLADELKQKHSIHKAIVIKKDLAKENAAQELYNEVKQQGITVDVLVNDAGVGVHGMFATETDWEKESAMIHLNTLSLTHLTKLYLKEMVARNEGKILNLASIVSIMPSPLMAVYAGTKAYVYNFTQSLVNELKDTNVTITALLPNATDTDFFRKAGAENARVTEMLDDAVMVAEEGYKALMKGETKVIPGGLMNKSYEVIAHLAPEEALAAMMRKNMEPKGSPLINLSKKEQKQLAVGLGLAVVSLVGYAIFNTLTNLSEYDKARYRYKFGRASREAKRTLNNVSESLSETLANAKATVSSTLAS